jgi:hypothetical protein
VTSLGPEAGVSEQDVEYLELAIRLSDLSSSHLYREIIRSGL